MDLKRIKARLDAAKTDCGELRVLARDLGDEFPRCRLEVLDEFRTLAVRYLLEMPSDAARSYLGALLDITAAYSAAIEAVLRENEYAEVVRDHGLELELLTLAVRPLLMGQLLDRLITGFITKAQIEYRLQLLCSIGLVEGAGEPPVYRLTLLGERIAKKLKDENK